MESFVINRFSTSSRINKIAVTFCFDVWLMVVTRFYPDYTYTEIKFNAVPLSPWKNRFIIYVLLLLGMISLFLLFSKTGIA